MFNMGAYEIELQPPEPGALFQYSTGRFYDEDGCLIVEVQTEKMQ